MSDAVRTTVKDPETIGAYDAAWLSCDDGIDAVTYTGPGVREHIRTWNAWDRMSILHALNAAYTRGRQDAQQEIRHALGVDP